MAILLATQDKELVERCSRAASAEHLIEVAATLDALIARLGAAMHEIVLVDGDIVAAPREQQIARVITLAGAARVVVMTAKYDEDEEIALLRAGVKGCCRRSVDPESLRQVLSVTQSGVWVTNSLLPRLVSELQRFAVTPAQRTASASSAETRSSTFKQKLATLTPREQDIVKLIAAGASNKQVAIELDISERTVKGHLSNVFQKLGVADRLKLVLYMNE